MLKKYNVLLLGDSEFETLLGKKIAQSPYLNQLYAIPGNTDLLEQGIVCFSNIHRYDIEKFIEEYNIQIVLPGPYCSLDLETLSELNSSKTKVLSPNSDLKLFIEERTSWREYLKNISIAIPKGQNYDHVDGAQQYIETLCFPLAVKIESPDYRETKYCVDEDMVKRFIHETLRDHIIERTGYKIIINNKVFTDVEDVYPFINNLAFPIMGKTNQSKIGCTIRCNNKEDFKDLIDKLIKEKVHGDDGMDILIEDYLEGNKFNATALIDGNTIVLFPFLQHILTKQDNAGARSLYTSPKIMNKKNWDILEKMLVMPTIHAVNNYLNKTKEYDDDNTEKYQKYKGILSLEIVWAKNQPYIVDMKFNWDLWAFYLLSDILESDWLQLLVNFLHDKLDNTPIQWSSKTFFSIFVPKEDIETSKEIKTAFQEDNLFDTQTTYYPENRSAKRETNQHGAGIVFSTKDFKKSVKEIKEYWENNNYSNVSSFLYYLNTLEQKIS
ncbi:MAG: hypothetical protein KBC30_05360 [Planctomycetes bacterium]|nr:hypothetical protein [Planctomycetota bacterium]HNZ66352.1 hypothetical protein [Planctomycetota bacterium]